MLSLGKLTRAIWKIEDSSEKIISGMEDTSEGHAKQEYQIFSLQSRTQIHNIS